MSSPNPSDSPPPGLTEAQRLLVVKTWALAKKSGNEQLGVLLFRTLFAQTPAALQLFPKFKDLPPQELYESKALLTHASGVIGTLDAGVGLLSDLDTLVPILTGLGKRHAGYGVIPAHYDALKDAVFETLAIAAGRDEIGAKGVGEAWTVVYGMIAGTMIAGGEYK